MSADVTGAPSDPRRRGLLYAAVAAGAAIAGAGVALWKWSPQGPESADPTLWNADFETPTGAPLSMRSFRGRPLLLNFWATWCPPCVEEMPLLDAFFRQNSAKHPQVLGLAIDQPSAVRVFLQRTPVAYPIGLAGLGGTELSKSLGNESGGLPFTVLIGPGSEIKERKMGRLSQADLGRWAQFM
jgi:thiol-disulfide isomerase/thioredoxin